MPIPPGYTHSGIFSKQQPAQPHWNYFQVGILNERELISPDKMRGCDLHVRVDCISHRTFRKTRTSGAAISIGSGAMTRRDSKGVFTLHPFIIIIHELESPVPHTRSSQSAPKYIPPIRANLHIFPPLTTSTPLKNLYILTRPALPNIQLLPPPGGSVKPPPRAHITLFLKIYRAPTPCFSKNFTRLPPLVPILSFFFFPIPFFSLPASSTCSDTSLERGYIPPTRFAKRVSSISVWLSPHSSIGIDLRCCNSGWGGLDTPPQSCFFVYHYNNT